MRYDIMESELGPILLARDQKGIQWVHFLDRNRPPVEYDTWQKDPQDPLLKKARRQLQAYFAGERQSFTLPLSLKGTDFQIRVWQALTTIPYGQTWSYGQLAADIGNPRACRAVGNANGKNKIAILVP